MAKKSWRKYRKAQFFIISAFTIVSILYFISRWMEPYTVIDTSSIASMEEPFIFNNLMDKTHEVIQNSKDVYDLKYNLQEFESFVKDYGITKNLNIKFQMPNMTKMVQMAERRIPAEVYYCINMTSPTANLRACRNETFYKV
ncbi:MAG TPA: hypothetical protein VJ343_02815 [archaeon]|nr:hypothetical protein [archaeon]